MQSSMQFSQKSILLILCILFTVLLLFGCDKDTDDLEEDNTGETTETGGTLGEWKEKIKQNTGEESEAARTLAACGDLMNEKAVNIRCSNHEGWSMVNTLEVTDITTEQTYQLQDIRQGGCERTEPQHVETGTMVTQEEESSLYQVSCNLVCVWWECKDSETFDAPEEDNTPVDEEGEEESEDTLEDTTTEQQLPETWTGTITAQLEDLGASCSGGEVKVEYVFALNSPVSLFSALNGVQEITLWSDPNYEATSGNIQGTATIINQPPHEGVIYCELEEGSSEEVSLTFYATGDEQVIQLSEVPGSDKNIRNKRFGKEYYYHEEAGLTEELFLAGFPPLLQATSLSETEISGILKEGYGFSGTFALHKQS